MVGVHIMNAPLKALMNTTTHGHLGQKRIAMGHYRRGERPLGGMGSSLNTSGQARASAKTAQLGWLS